VSYDIVRILRIFIGPDELGRLGTWSLTSNVV